MYKRIGARITSKKQKGYISKPNLLVIYSSIICGDFKVKCFKFGSQTRSVNTLVGYLTFLYTYIYVLKLTHKMS